MPKKSKDHKTHKGSSSKDHGNQKASQMKGSEKGGQEKELKNAGQAKGSENAGKAKGFENANNNLPEVQGPSIPNGSIGNIEDIAKKGCLPKLSILVLPFVAMLVYVLLNA